MRHSAAAGVCAAVSSRAWACGREGGESGGIIRRLTASALDVTSFSGRLAAAQVPAGLAEPGRGPASRTGMRTGMGDGGRGRGRARPSLIYGAGWRTAGNSGTLARRGGEPEPIRQGEVPMECASSWGLSETAWGPYPVLAAYREGVAAICGLAERV